MNNKEVKIIIAGDYHGGYQKNNILIDIIEKASNPQAILGDVAQVIKESDFSIVNIEYPITNAIIPVIKYGPSAKSNPKCLLPLQSVGFSLASLATNHTYDFMDKGVKDTIRYCKSHNIETVGAGENIYKARKIYYKKIKEYKIAVLNFAETQYNIATEKHGGANPLNIIDNIKDIRVAKENADFVFVIIHGGPDLCQYPSPRMVKQYRFYADEGASAIICHHSRIISNFENYNGVPIFYGLGNFVHITLKPDEKEQTGLLAVFNIKDKKQLSFEPIPIHFDMKKKRLQIIKGMDREKILQQIQINNKLLNNIDELAKVWGDEILKNEVRYLLLLSNMPNIVFRIFRKLRLLNVLKKMLLINKKRFLPIWNILRNESHNDNINLILSENFKEVN